MALSEIHQTHLRLMQLVQRHGTDEERTAMEADLVLMRGLRLADPEGHWEPMEAVILPSFLLAKCKRVAKERVARAERFSLENKHGARRSLADEIRSVEAQVACQLILGLPLFFVPNHTAARRQGNVGENISAFCPKAGSFQLIVGEKEPPTRVFFLMHQDGTNRYACRGWIRAGEGQRSEFQRRYVRDGITSRPYVIPTDILSPLRAWFT